MLRLFARPHCLRPIKKKIMHLEGLIWGSVAKQAFCITFSWKAPNFSPVGFFSGHIYTRIDIDFTIEVYYKDPIMNRRWTIWSTYTKIQLDWLPTCLSSIVILAEASKISYQRTNSRSKAKSRWWNAKMTLKPKTSKKLFNETKRCSKGTAYTTSLKLFDKKDQVTILESFQQQGVELFRDQQNESIHEFSNKSFIHINNILHTDKGWNLGHKL